MATEQYEDLTNHATLASGGNIIGTIFPLENLSLSAAVYGSHKLLGTDLSKTDPTTGKYSRFELGMYDVTSPTAINVLLLGEVYANWTPGNHRLKVGRFKLGTPFLNLQDGRMIPTLSQGIGYGYEEDHWNLQLYYINAMAPRSTSKWRRIENTIGLYSEGRNPDGTSGNHLGHINTDGLAIAGVERRGTFLPDITLYHYYLQNIFNLSYLQLDQSYSLSKKYFAIGWQAQGVGQFSSGEGGNGDPDLRYMDPGHKSVGFGGRIWLKLHQNRFSVQAFRITEHGRMLFPRGWGVDPYVTFQKPERLEGQGDTFSLMGKVQRKFRAGIFNINGGISYGMTNLTDPKKPALNKYALPSHRQLNTTIRIKPAKGQMKDFSLYLFWSHKRPKESNIENTNFIYNKVNLHLFQITLNYNFSL